MLRLLCGPLNSNWSDLLLLLFRDLEPLGHSVERLTRRRFSLAISEPDDHVSEEKFWDRAHNMRHLMLVSERANEISAFEARHADVFVRMEVFQPSAIRPSLEVVDFADERHRSIVDYFTLYQSVTSRKRVGRQMGLLLWDTGQTAHTPLIGAAVLASARYSQHFRDVHLGWKPDYPRTSVHFDEQARSVRVNGLAKMMQLSVACALPPYNILSGAWLAALSPFTELGQQAFAAAARKEPDPDLAVVVTTTGKGISGAPFRGHRVGQLSDGHIEAAPGASGDVFARAAPVVGAPPLRASFEGLISKETLQRATKLFAREDAKEFAQATNHIEQSAISYALRRLGLNRQIFAGNEMGVHIGMLGRDTPGYLAAGLSRPPRKRPRLEWDTVVAVWARRFLPPSDSGQDTATPETLTSHKIARRRRLEAARSYPQDRIRLSSLIDHPGGGPQFSVSDLVPTND
jgi:hypothetical protein